MFLSKFSAFVCGLIFVALVLCVGSCRKKAPVEVEPVRPVKLVTLAQPGIYRKLELPGQVQAFQDAKLSFLVSGRINEIPVLRGQNVKQGEVLARLDPKDYQNRYNAAKAAALERKAYLKRIKLAVEKDVATAMELDEAQRQYDVAKAQMDIEQKALDDTVLTAEFDGQIGEKYKENFQDVAAKEEIMRLQDVSKLKVVINVPEGLQIMSSGSPSPEEVERKTRYVFATFQELGDREFNLKYYEADRTADPRTNTYAVTFLMENPTDAAILPGMSATVKGRFRLRGAEAAFVIPVEAVFAEAGADRFVWVQKPETGAVSKRKVKAGALTGAGIEVLDGLSAGEVVAVSGVHHLREGMKVRAVTLAEAEED